MEIEEILKEKDIMHFKADVNCLHDCNNNVRVWLPVNASKFRKFRKRLRYGWFKYRYEWE